MPQTSSCQSATSLAVLPKGQVATRSGRAVAAGSGTSPEVEAPTLQAGMSGSLYFEIDGELYGPAGQGTATVRQLSVARDDLLQNYQLADFAQDPELSKIINMAEAQTPLE